MCCTGAGAPETGAVQEVIAWQSRTIAMMYKLVADALRDVGDNERVPTDYLLFFCLGKAFVRPATTCVALVHVASAGQGA